MCHPLVSEALDRALLDSTSSTVEPLRALPALSTRRGPATCADSAVDLSRVSSNALRAELRRRRSVAERRSRRLDSERFDIAITPDTVESR